MDRWPARKKQDPVAAQPSPWAVTAVVPTTPTSETEPPPQTGQPAGPGRPRTEVPRRVRVPLALTAAEREQWQAAAAAAGMKQVARWAREVVSASLRSESTDRPASEVAAVRRELVRIGTNLNQIARAVNTANRAGAAPDVDQVAQELAAMRADLERLDAHLDGPRP